MAETLAPPPPPNPNTTTAPSAPSPAPAPAPDVEGKKRKMELEEFYNSDYCKIRRVVHDLRPLFLEVLQTPDFKRSKVANDIKKQINTVLELSRKMRNDMAPNEKPIKREGGSAFGVKSELPDAGKPQVCGSATMSSTSFHEKAATDAKVAEMKELAKKLDGQSFGSYVIGGSQVGWNFLLYPGSDTIYYGETKECFRARQSAK